MENQRVPALIVSLREALVLIFCAAILAGLFLADRREPLSSAETRFVEKSSRGLQIVPASCPSDPHYQGQCSGEEEGECSAGYICVADDLYYQYWEEEEDEGSCQQDFVQECFYGCSGNACLPTPSIEFEPFAATTPWGTEFTASGHLEARPLLVPQGDEAQLYWQAENVQSCEVVGSNGDSWDGAFSGASGTTTSAIIEQTIFTLSCTALEGAKPSTIQKDVIVNVLPVFEET